MLSVLLHSLELLCAIFRPLHSLLTLVNRSQIFTFQCNSLLPVAVPITAGNYGITKNQINSSIVCRLLGQFLYVMILVGVAVWFGLDGGALAILLCVLLLFFTIGSVTTYRMFELRRDVIDQRSIFRYWTKHQVTKPSVAFTWVCICFEIVFFYVIPLLNLFLVKNISSALVFGFFGLFSAFRVSCEEGTNSTNIR